MIDLLLKSVIVRYQTTVFESNNYEWLEVVSNHACNLCWLRSFIKKRVVNFPLKRYWIFDGIIKYNATAFIANCKQIVVGAQPGSTNCWWLQSVYLKRRECCCLLFLDLNQLWRSSTNVDDILFRQSFNLVEQRTQVPHLNKIVILNSQQFAGEVVEFQAPNRSALSRMCRLQTDFSDLIGNSLGHWIFFILALVVWNHPYLYDSFLSSCENSSFNCKLVLDALSWRFTLIFISESVYSSDCIDLALMPP